MLPLPGNPARDIDPHDLSQSPDGHIFRQLKERAISLAPLRLVVYVRPGFGVVEVLKKTVLGIPLPVGEHRHIGDDKRLNTTLTRRTKTQDRWSWGARWMLAPRKCRDELTVELPGFSAAVAPGVWRA